MPATPLPPGAMDRLQLHCDMDDAAIARADGDILLSSQLARKIVDHILKRFASQVEPVEAKNSREMNDYLKDKVYADAVWLQIKVWLDLTEQIATGRSDESTDPQLSKMLQDLPEFLSAHNMSPWDLD